MLYQHQTSMPSVAGEEELKIAKASSNSSYSCHRTYGSTSCNRSQPATQSSSLNSQATVTTSALTSSESNASLNYSSSASEQSLLLSLDPMNGEYLVPLRFDDGNDGDIGNNQTICTSTAHCRTDTNAAVSRNLSPSLPSESSLISAWLPNDDFVNTNSNMSLENNGNGILGQIWQLLGFESNPMRDSPDLRLAMLSNLSTSYNVVNISIALQLMLQSSPIQSYIDEETSTVTQGVCSAALIGGMMLGQLLGGIVGDAVGRHLALTLAMMLQIGSSVGSACVTMQTSSRGGEHSWTMFHTLAVWRFLNGVGCGSVYPLAATLTAESTDDKESRGKLVALTFSMQGVGYMLVPIVAVVLIGLFGESNAIAWRLLLAGGAVPGIIQITLRLQRRTSANVLSPSERVSPSSTHNDTVSSSSAAKQVLHSIRGEKHIFRKLMGTGVTWFLFDVLFYGNVLFQRVVLQAAFGRNETIIASVLDTLIISLIALPGYFVSVARIGRYVTPKYIQLQGFTIMSILYSVIGLNFYSLAKRKALLLFLYSSTFFFSNYGPNASTFMLPSMTFSYSSRSTLNGICAAFGKLGALLGALLFKPASQRFGDPAVLIMCAFISVVSAVPSLSVVYCVVFFYVSHQTTPTRFDFLHSLHTSRPALS